MPDPVISHLIGTVTLLGVALIITAAFTYVEYSNYMSSLNLMLAEVAESAGREIVEAVSVYTLGGSGASYMLMTLPSTLGGQPYLVHISGGGDNILQVTAKLQVYQQVKVVVMPNFGRYPVRAVNGTVPRESFSGMLNFSVSDTLLIPQPEGYVPGIVIYRSADADCRVPSFDPVRWKAICVGLAAIPAKNI
ncbi:MAG: hypothetical protein ABWK01_03725 [Infirmifilum sp.]